MRERRWPLGGMTTKPFDRTAHSIICPQPPTPKSPLLECNGTGRLRYAGAPRPVPLHHRAIRAQMKPGLYSSADEAWGSGQKACDPTEASVSAPAFTGQPGRFSQPRICGSGLFDLFSKNIAKID